MTNTFYKEWNGHRKPRIILIKKENHTFGYNLKINCFKSCSSLLMMQFLLAINLFEKMQLNHSSCFIVLSFKLLSRNDEKYISNTYYLMTILIPGSVIQLVFVISLSTFKNKSCKNLSMWQKFHEQKSNKSTILMKSA